MVEVREELKLALEADDRGRLENLIEQGNSEDFEILRKLVEDEETSTIYRRRALYAMGEWPNRENDSVSTIESVLPNLTELERITALSTLGRIGTPDARETIVRFQDDSNPDVRRQVVSGLARIEDDTALDTLREFAENDEAEHVRDLAQKKLQQIEEE